MIPVHLFGQMAPMAAIADATQRIDVMTVIRCGLRLRTLSGGGDRQA